MRGRAIDFHDVKGAVEQVLARFQARAVYFDRFPAEAGLTPEWLHPYRAARVVVEGATVGWFGQLHPREAAAAQAEGAGAGGRALSGPAVQAAAAQAGGAGRFRASSRCGAIFRWFWIESIAWEKIDQALAGLRIPELVEWRVREVFRDAKLGERRVLAAAGRDLPGRRPHAARGGVAELPGAGGGGCWQGWGAAAELKRRIGVDSALYLLG